MKYPSLDINLDNLLGNATLVRNECRRRGIEPVAVVKGFNALDEMVDVIVRAGFACIASSRIPHLRRTRERGLPVRTMLLRLPMLSEVEEAVRYCDVSLNSELETVARLDAAASRSGTVHDVLWMRDVGDLREGVSCREEFIRGAVEVEKAFRSIRLLGVGTSLSCYGTVRPSRENLSELVENAQAVESAIGRKLEVISGGSSSSTPLLLKGGVPPGVNQLRLGSVLMYHTLSLREDELPELRDVLTVTAEIIETGVKPTRPVGELAHDCFGNPKEFPDLGSRRRAILAVGAFDLGDCTKLRPLDAGVRVLGASSDHLVVDLEDAEKEFRLGDVLSFGMSYQSILVSTANGHVRKRTGQT